MGWYWLGYLPHHHFYSAVANGDDSYFAFLQRGGNGGLALTAHCTAHVHAVGRVDTYGSAFGCAADKNIAVAAAHKYRGACYLRYVCAYLLHCGGAVYPAERGLYGVGVFVACKGGVCGYIIGDGEFYRAVVVGAYVAVGNCSDELRTLGVAGDIELACGIGYDGCGTLRCDWCLSAGNIPVYCLYCAETAPRCSVLVAVDGFLGHMQCGIFYIEIFKGVAFCPWYTCCKAIYIGKVSAICKGSSINGFNTLSYYNGFKGYAVFKRIAFNCSNFVTYCYASKAAAISERIVSYCSNAIRYGYACKPGATIERTAFYCSNAVAYCYACKVGTSIVFTTSYYSIFCE